MVLPSARKLNCPGSNPHLGAFKINLVFLSLLKKISKFKKVSGAIPVFSR